MNNDLLTAVLIVGGFFMFIFCVFVDGFIRQWIATERNKRDDSAAAFTFAEKR